MRNRLPAAMLLLALASATAHAQVLVDNGFTYQGRLTDAGAAPTGLYDIQFTLWDASSGGTPSGTTITVDDVQVTAGLFAARLDFGTAFASYKRWLQFAVRPGASAGVFTTLLPRQEITGAPFATFSLAPWTNIPGSGISYNTGYSVGIGATPTFTDRLLVAADASNSNGIHGITSSAAYNAAGVQGDATGGNNPIGVFGTSYVANGAGVVGKANTTGGYFEAYSGSGSPVGVYARANVLGGVGLSASGQSYGVFSLCPMNIAVYADGNIGVQGVGTTTGVDGGSTTGVGVRGTAAGSPFTGYGDGVVGNATGGHGVRGTATTGRGVEGFATSSAGIGVTGDNSAAGTTGYLGSPAAGVAASGGPSLDGVNATANGPNKAGVAGGSSNAAGYGGYFYNTANGVALKAVGLCQVNTLQILGGSDLAEPFDVTAPIGSGMAIEPGMVVVIDPAHEGDLMLTDQPYDTRVAGIISGANGLAPGMVMKAIGQDHADGTHPVAMTGRVWCMVDASTGSIQPGDMLTTSATPGVAMKARDADRSHGAVIGKAMTALKEGRGMVLVFVNLQ